MKVREVLEAARECALAIRRNEELAELRRLSIGVQGHSYDVHSKSGILDPSRKIDDILDWEMEQNEEIPREPIEEAWEIVSGAEHVSDSLTIEIMTRYFLQAESLVELVRDFAVDRNMKSLQGLTRKEQVKVVSKTIEETIEQWESIGIAHLKDMA